MSWHQSTKEKIFEALKTTIQGIDEKEAGIRLQKLGQNVIESHAERSLWSVFIAQFKSLIVYLLIAATVISFIFGDYTEGIAILIVILINAAIGFVMERQALQSMKALKKLDRVLAKVIRKGELKEIPSEEIVPGDILFIEAGDIISADARLAEVNQLSIDESPLTGESLPVDKLTAQLPEDTSLAERNNMIYKGTAVTRGNGKAVVVATGMKTELGQISRLVQAAGKEEIPLNVKLESFSRKLVWLTIAIAIPFLVVGMLEGRDLYLMIETAIALAVAAIPEGLPIVATIALARGMLKLAHHNVIVKKLAAVETLGETNVIFTDKTGTLTENKLVVNTVYVPENIMEIKWNDHQSNIDFVPTLNLEEHQENIKRLVEVAVLCNNATYDNHEKSVGDPIEIALLKMAEYYKEGLPAELRKNNARIREQPFDSDTKVMGTLHNTNSGYLVAAKGATEELLQLCSHVLIGGEIHPLSDKEKHSWHEKTNELAVDGLRVLAFAWKKTDEPEKNFMSNLVFTGLLGFLDPARADVPDSIKECKQAGIKVIMVTGDHPATARNISLKIGLISQEHEQVVHGKNIRSISNADAGTKKELEKTTVFSRVTPKQKLELVQLYQNEGFIVGMTGDGVNDAPALKKANIGIAMGIRGTQVAREAADIVLQDDAFPSIVKAIKQGRVIFNNIKTFIIYLLSCNLSEIFVVSLAAFANLALPLQPLQILFLNIVTDVFPALALGMGEGNPSIMQKPPRDPKEPLLTRKNWMSISVYSIVMTASVFSVFLYSHYYKEVSDVISNNIAFLSLAFAQLIHPLNMISARENLFRNDITRNPHLWMAVIFCTAIIITVFYIPYTKEILSLHTLDAASWVLVGIGSVTPLIIVQILKRLRIVA